MERKAIFSHHLPKLVFNFQEIDPTLLNCGDIENRDGLGGTRSGLAGTFSEVERTSKDETESTEEQNF